MARRTLVNTDEKMLDAAILIGSEEGIDAITSRKIAKICGITDPLVFVHFKTMDNLMTEVYKKICGELYENAKTLDLKGTPEDFHEKWDEIVKYFVDNPVLTKFLYNIIHSKYGEKVPNEFKEFYLKIIRNALEVNNSGLNDDQCIIFYYLSMESLLHFAVRILRGEIELNEKTSRVAYKLIFGGYEL